MHSIPTIVITGFMGSGKTAVAQALSTQLNLEMIDLDESITNANGRTPAQIIAQDGERAFRAIETEALKRLLEAKGARVIALGGGAWIEEINRKIIEESNCLTIWLDTPFHECWKRIESSGEYRPLGKTEHQAKELFDSRRPIYQLATFHVKVLEEETVDQLAARIKLQVAQTK